MPCYACGGAETQPLWAGLCVAAIIASPDPTVQEQLLAAGLGGLV